jgi:pyruvate kinase
VIRLNFSHGTHEQHKKVIDCVRGLSKSLGRAICILQDLQGPKHRVGKFDKGAVTLVTGQTVTISTKDCVGSAKKFSTDFAEFSKVVKPGQKIFLDDGNLELVVEAVSGSEVEAKVVFGGVLKDRKGMNLPGARMPGESLTEKRLG